MTKVSKKPWRKVGRLEHRIIHLENQIEILKTTTSAELLKIVRVNAGKFADLETKIDSVSGRMEYVLIRLESEIHKLIDPEG